jgi:hypothetical protein
VRWGNRLVGDVVERGPEGMWYTQSAQQRELLAVADWMDLGPAAGPWAAYGSTSGCGGRAVRRKRTSHVPRQAGI